MSKLKRYKKYFVNKTAVIICSLFAVLSIAVYGYSSFQINQTDLVVPTMSGSQNFDSGKEIDKEIKKKAIFETIGDISLIVFSTLGLNLLLGVLIEKNSKNALYDEILTEDLLSDEKFLNTLPKDKQTILIKQLEEMNFFGDDKICEEMYSSVRHKIANSQHDYYYSYQNIDVKCRIKTDYIEKEIIRTFKMRSFSPEYVFKNFSLSICKSQTFENGIKHYEIKSAKINNQKLDLNNDIIYIETDIENEYLINCNFNKKSKYLLKHPLKIYQNTDTVIELKYISRVPLNDTSYSLRTNKPCKQFNFLFRIDSDTDYNIYSYACGFYENARNTPAGAGQNIVKFEFNDWIFPEDGVIINFSKK